ncbi:MULTISPECIES: major capsid protein [Bartonella]|uniref:major capsid protein n=1 Tax=Bartonella TaxID=773 RepID=UPI001ABC11A8|nr:major capsid protein [Bartonella capreoli]
MDINFFNHNAFSSEVMTKAIENYEFKPNLIGSLNLFKEVATNKTTVSIEKRKLSLIPVSERGTPPTETEKDEYDRRCFKTTPIIKEYIIKAEEIKDWREFGIEDQFETVMKFIAKKQKKLISEIELIWENMQLGAIQGVVLDADGSVIYDCYEEWGITPQKAIDFKLDEDTTDVAYMVNQVVTNMAQASGNTFSIYSRIIGFCGDEFFFKLKNHKAIRDTYLNTPSARILKNTAGITMPGTIESGSFKSFDFAGATFINYCNIHDYNMNTNSSKRSIGIKPDQCQFVPVNVPGAFQKTFSPDKGMEFVNTVGKPLYTRLIVDRESATWAKLEVCSYPLFVCARPEMLFKAVVRAK